MKFYPQDADNICKTILVGMPAAGKSTMTRYLAEGVAKDTGIKLREVSTDKRIKELAKDKGNAFVVDFLNKRNIPAEDQKLLIHASDFIEKYSEPMFRDFESAVIIDMLNKGDFNHNIVDLGGKAILHPETSKAFKEKGYNCIFLDTNKDILTAHVIRDYERWKDGAEITRSNINKPIDRSVKAEAGKSILAYARHYYVAPDPYQADSSYKQHPDYVQNLKTARDKMAHHMVSTLLEQREKGYKTSSTASVKVSGDLEKDAAQIMKIVRANSKILTKSNSNGR